MAGSGDKAGVVAAIEGLAAEGRLAPDGLDAPAEQLPLAGLDDPAAVVAEGGDLAEIARGPGRPKGSRNRRTEAWQDWLLTRYRSPLEGLARTASMPLAALKEELQCDLLEAAKVQQAAQIGLAPYLHQKLPQAVEIGGEGLLPVLFVGVRPQPVPMPGGGLGLPIEGEIIEIKESEEKQ